VSDVVIIPPDSFWRKNSNVLITVADHDQLIAGFTAVFVNVWKFYCWKTKCVTVHFYWLI